MEFKYKKNNSLQKRKEDFKKASEGHPNKIPIICEKVPTSKVPDIDKSKYLINEEFTLTQFISTIRKRLNLEKEQALFFLVNGNKSLTGEDSMLVIYDKYKDEDGFLYIAYSSELVWG